MSNTKVRTTTPAKFANFTAAAKKRFTESGGQILPETAPEIVFEAPVIDAPVDLSTDIESAASAITTAVSSATATAGTAATPRVNDPQYHIEGDSIFLNVEVEILGQKYNLRGIRITEKSQCMTTWDAVAKEFTTPHNPTMSLINMIRTHGSAVVTKHMSLSGSVREEGEVATLSDPIADMLAAQAKAKQDRIDAEIDAEIDNA